MKYKNKLLLALVFFLTSHFTLLTSAHAAITADSYFPFSGVANASTTIGPAEIPVPLTGIISELRCRTVAATASGESWTFTLYVNGVASKLSCTIGSLAQTCTDLGNTVPVTTGQRLVYFADNTAGVPSITPTCTAILYEYR